MANLTTTLSISGTAADFGSTLSLSTTDNATITEPFVGFSRITATTTGGNSIIAPNVDATRYIYIKHTGLNSAGGSSGADQVKVETADGTEIMRISKDEFAFFPHYAGGAGLIQLEATANTVQVEYAYFTRD
jgi:hypothetical protein|tara:strand:+ start:62 stop:457 length:396 start_codon:yes stop_codon:yes gene_type:complete